MTALNEEIEAKLADSRKEDDRAFSYKGMILAGLDTETDSIPLDMQIEATLEQLAMVKNQHRYLRTKELFFERILGSKTVDDAFPTPNEMAQMEMALGKEKKLLRSIKASRAEAEKKFAETAADIGKAAFGKDQARSEAGRSLRQAKAAAQLDHLKTALESGNEEDVENLVRNVEELDTNCCQLLLRELRNQKSVHDKEAAKQSRKTDSLRVEVEAIEEEISKLESSTNVLKTQITESDKENSGQAALRHECTLLEQLGEMLSTLTGVRVADIRSSGMTFHLNAFNFVAPSKSLTPESFPTHTLDVEFGSNELGETIVAYMHLSPPDVDVSDLREDLGLSLQSGVQKVCSRLSMFMSTKPPTA